jgi:hypothetical protein
LEEVNKPPTWPAVAALKLFVSCLVFTFLLATQDEAVSAEAGAPCFLHSELVDAPRVAVVVAVLVVVEVVVTFEYMVGSISLFLNS